MKNIADKSPGSQYDSPEFNSSNNEIKNVVEDTAQTLSAGDLHQISKSMSNYSAGGAAYHDSGSANAYILSRILPYQAITTLRDQMQFRFRASHSNTGAATAAVGTTGAKAIKNRNGSILTAGEIVAGDESEIVYNSSAGGHYTLISRNDAATNVPFSIAVEASPNNYTIDLGGIYTAYNDSVYFRCRFPAPNTGSVNIDVDGLGNKVLVGNLNHTTLSANQVEVNQEYLISYNPTINRLQLTNRPTRAETVVQNNFISIAGTASALVLSPIPALAGYQNNMFFSAHMNLSTNNANATLNISGLGSKKIYAEGLDVLQRIEANTLRSGIVYLFAYNDALDTAAGGFILLGIAGSSLAEARAGALKTHFIPPHLLALMTQENKYIYANAAGAVNVYTAAMTPALTAYPADSRFFIRINITNTGAATLNINGLGAKAIESPDLQPLIGGELVAGVRYLLLYTGTQFQIMTPTLDTTGTLTKTGASKNVSVTPHSMVSHKGVTKAWYSGTLSGGILTDRDVHDITANRVSSGLIEITVGFAMSTAYFPKIVSGTQSATHTLVPLIDRVFTQTTTKFRVTFHDVDGVSGAFDPDFFSVEIKGDKA